jgi:Subtilase family
VLTRSRIAAAAGLMLLVATCALAGAPSASGSPASPTGTTAQSASAAASSARATLAATAATSTRFPSGARSRLLKEMLSAWQITRGQGVRIAVLSTAVDRVSGLSGKLTIGPDYAPASGASAVDGTILASLIAGSGPTGTNPFGTIGRAPGASILAERIVDYDSGKRGSQYLKDGVWQNIVAKAIRYAVSHGAGVIVTFESGSEDSPTLDSAVAYALSKDVIVVGSSLDLDGKLSTAAYPDSLPGVINFTGTDLTGLPKPTKPVQTTANSSVLVAAPDNVLFATGPGNEPYTAWGTYSSTAWVVGTIALLKAVYPHITSAEVARALAESASYQPAGGYNTKVGFGLINPVGALHDAGSLVKLSTTAAAGPDAVSASTRFGAPQHAVISAVRHSGAKLGGYGGAIVAGLILLAVALILARRRRPAPVAGGSPGIATAAPAEPAAVVPPEAGGQVPAPRDASDEPSPSGGAPPPAEIG